jgi:hypothetical protein
MNRIRYFGWMAVVLAIAALSAGAAEQDQNNLAPDEIIAKNLKTCRSSGTCGPMTTPLRLDVDLKPLNKPQDDRNFAYSVEITNSSTLAVWVDVWAEVELPSGKMLDPILLKTNFRLPAGLIARQEIERPLLKSLPAGIFAISLQMGTYPDAVLARDEFTFEKRPGEIRGLKSGVNFLKPEGGNSEPASPDRGY